MNKKQREKDAEEVEAIKNAFETVSQADSPKFTDMNDKDFVPNTRLLVHEIDLIIRYLNYYFLTLL